jgi:threonyl-tRNA synthetase
VRQKTRKRKGIKLFAFSQQSSQGLPLWLPKGAALRERLEQFLKKAQKKPVTASHHATY